MTALLYAEEVVSGAAGYAPSDQLAKAWDDKRCARVWHLGARIVSLQLTTSEGKGIWKARERLMHPEPLQLLDDLESVGVHHPSSYADCYHQLAGKTPRLRYTFNALFSWWAGGPWSEARRTGEHKGTWYRYDLQSAYRWAATLGLPDPDTYEVRQRKTGDQDGVWVVELQEDRPDLPAVYQHSGRRAVVSTEEMERYNLKCRVIRGVVWTRMYEPEYVDRTLAKLPCAKEAGRAYWGRWIARDPLKCWTPKSEWDLKNIHANFVWGWLIVGRVRLRVWESAKDAAHVYVDEVLVPYELPTAFGPGQWKLKERYDRGVTVHRTGWYGSADTTTMRTGHARN